MMGPILVRTKWRSNSLVGLPGVVIGATMAVFATISSSSLVRILFVMGLCAESMHYA